MLTDYALAVAALVFAVRLFQLGLGEKHRSIALWAMPLTSWHLQQGWAEPVMDSLFTLPIPFRALG